MKTKAKPTLSILLALTLILSVFVGCNKTLSSNPNNTENNTWVLTKETVNYADGSDSRETTYQYDSLGRIVGLRQSGDSWSYEYQDILHDEFGNIISYTEKYVDYIFGDNKSYIYSFSYDENNNCVSTVKRGDYKLTSDYDERNNIIKETYFYADEKITHTHSLTYDSTFLIQDEIEIKDSTDTWYNLDTYSYDENNNLYTIKHYYSNEDNIENVENAIQLNGRYYELVYTNYHIWEKLNNVAVETSTNKIENTNNTISSSEIGFNNIDEWGSKLIEIKSDNNDNYVFEDSFGKYVIIMEGTGIWEFYTEQNYAVMSSYYVNGVYTTEAAGAYTVLDNNTFSSGGYAMRILNRFTYNGVNVVDMTNGGSLSYIYIPYSTLDIDTMELYQENDRFDYYKCYLK